MSIIDGDKLLLEGRIKACEQERDALLDVMDSKVPVFKRIQSERDEYARLYENALKREFALQQERDRLRDQIHTCGPTCSKAGCVNRRLREAAQAVVDMWESPWSNKAEPTGDYIRKLRDALGEKT